MKILITGADGFIGRNVAAQLASGGHDILRYVRGSTIEELRQAVAASDWVCHLAGANRPVDPADFSRSNTDLARTLCEAAERSGRPLPIIYASSTQAAGDTLYGASKRAAEDVLLEYSNRTAAPVYIFRLPGVFGKWSRPNYNSVVATFCHNVARDIPIRVDDPDRLLILAYVDDVVSAFNSVMSDGGVLPGYCSIPVTYETSLGALALAVRQFRDSRATLTLDGVGRGFGRALYATYVSFIPPESFAYSVPAHSDARGIFVEMLKTHGSGQFSFFTTRPGVTRGGHFHHSKTEKFLVVHGTARFRFREILSGESYELTTSGKAPQVVDTVPGWAHEITNVGDSEMVVMLWASESFDPAKPDTYSFTL